MATSDSTVLPFEHLSDRDLLATADVLRGRERSATVELIQALVEIDRRSLYLAAGFASLYAYCTNRLGMSEHEAYLRMQGARTARSYPLILEMLADGRLTLTAVVLVAKELSADNHRALLDAVSHKSKRDILELLAALHPQPDLRSSLTIVATPGTISEVADPKNAAGSAQGNRGCADVATLGDAARAFERSAIAPLSPERYRLQVTISREAYEILRRLQDLMRHTVPNGDPAPIVERGLQMLLGEVERRQTAQAERPHRFTACKSGSRYVPAHVRRAVWERDGGQCAFIGVTGRCHERACLEFHHVVPYAEGGATTVENLELRCRAHNSFEAELLHGGEDNLPQSVAAPSPPARS